MAAETPLTIAIFADTNLSPNGVRTFCHTFREWAQRTDSVRVVEVMPGLCDGETVSGNTKVISIKPSARVPNPVYPEQLLGYYSRAKVRRIIEAIDGCKIIHIATPGQPSRIGVIPIGLADGYRKLRPDTRPYALWHGQRLPIQGVSLEYVSLDLSEFGDARVGDEVILLGREGDDEIRLDDLANWQGAAPHEVLMSFEGRLPARYLGENPE